MFIRIARFEGGTKEGLDERVAGIKQQIESGEQMPAGLDRVKRVVLLVDRDNTRFANLVYCDTLEDMEAADAALNEMSPPGDGGARTSVERYEVALDTAM